MRFIIVFLIFIKLLAPFWCIVTYCFNYDYIVKNLCVDRAKIASTCNGKCYLLKKFKEESGKKEEEKKISIHLLRFPIINTIDVLEAPRDFFHFVRKNIINRSTILKGILCLQIDPPPDF